MLKSAWTPDKSLLTLPEKAAYERDHSVAAYNSTHLRRDVIAALNDYFGLVIVEPKKKAIKVNQTAGYVDADVVPALQHRVYLSYDSLTKGRYIEGTKLSPPGESAIINFPKIHKINGIAKNSDTNKNFKATVRQVKQLKRRAVKAGKIDPKLAPGYLIECMVFNVPDTVFVDDHHKRLIDTISWLLRADYSSFKAVDKIHELFKTDPGNFSVDVARSLTIKLAEEITA
jgi:hypothetical protein